MSGLLVPTLPPTDNLYKFMTITGLVICFIAVYGFVSIYSANESKNSDLRKEFHSAGVSSTRQMELHKQSEEINKRDVSNAVTLTVIAGGGLLVSISGLALWYWRHQRFLDRITRIDCLKRERDFELEQRPASSNPGGKSSVTSSADSAVAPSPTKETTPG